MTNILDQSRKRSGGDLPMSKLPRQKMSDVFTSSTTKNKNFHFLSNPHNRFRLLEEPVELRLHFDREGFTRCYNYDPITKRIDDSKGCRKCTNDQRSSKFYCLNAKNIDNGRIAILPISLTIASEIAKLAKTEGVWPVDQKNGYSVDIYRVNNPNTNRNYWKVNKVRQEPLSKEDYSKRIPIESVFEFKDAELEEKASPPEDNISSSNSDPGIEEDDVAEGVEETEGFFHEVSEDELDDAPVLDDADLGEIPGLEDD